jgi:hypothetical protein
MTRRSGCRSGRAGVAPLILFEVVPSLVVSAETLWLGTSSGSRAAGTQAGVAYSRSPTASRASFGPWNHSYRTTFPSRTVHSADSCAATSTPLVRQWARYRMTTATRSPAGMNRSGSICQSPQPSKASWTARVKAARPCRVPGSTASGGFTYSMCPSSRRAGPGSSSQAQASFDVLMCSAHVNV